MTEQYDRQIEATGIEIAADDPLHDDADLPRSVYTVIDHFGHVTEIAVS